VPIGAVESTTDYRVVFDSSRERIAGRVKVLGRAKRRLTLARVAACGVPAGRVTFPQVEHQWAAIARCLHAVCRNHHPAGRGTEGPR